MDRNTRFLLTEDALPQAWYNINPDLPAPPAPLLHPATLEPADPEFLLTMFTQRTLAEAASLDRWVEIPGPIRQAYQLWRPTPLVRATRLEEALDTPAHLYYKLEGASPTGSHKPNTAVAQAYWAKEENVSGLTTETGAGQWGSALSFACNLFGLGCRVFMVKVSYHQKPYREILMRTFGATVTASPSRETAFGRRVLAEDPDSPGSLGIAVSEAIEAAIQSGGSWKFSLGSALAPVVMHQTVVGLEALQQMEMAGEYPDVLIGCVGGGSNFGGFVFPFLHHDRTRGTHVRVIAAEPTACPSLTRGNYTYDFPDSAGLAPLVRMHTLGHRFVPPGIHAGGLRYHGMAPQVSLLHEYGVLEAVAVSQNASFRAAVQFARAEGVLPAPESAHAVKVAIDEALRCREEGRSRVVAFNLSGHGHFDLAAYDAHLKGELKDFEISEETLAESLSQVPDVPIGSR